VPLFSSQERLETILAVSKVLNFNLVCQGKKVAHLDYEAYPEMALPSLLSISRRAKENWKLLGVAVTHRLGRVPIGEESILIAVSHAHREEAWRAAEYILEDVKAKTEVWKRESYEDPELEPEWKANCPPNV
jgi:molybdopterin synthase catalytic subunit